ncbi:MAG: lytic transglycosylase domain-containing protein [Sulfurimonas sp.]
MRLKLRMLKFLLLVIILPFVLLAKVADYNDVFEKAGAHYNIPPLLLKNIATIESGGNPNAIRRNDNGSKDYGLMQINSIHFHRLAQWGINEQNILNPQINIFVGSWLLSEHIKEKGFNLQAIGNYHSKTAVYKEKWLHRLVVALKASP